jgi:hypothetical protein
MAVGIRQGDHVAASIRKKLALPSPTSGGRSVGTVRSRTQATEFFLKETHTYSKCSNSQRAFNVEPGGTLSNHSALKYSMASPIGCEYCSVIICMYASA